MIGPVKSVLMLWLIVFAWVATTSAVVLGTFVALSPFMSSKTIGFVWCGVMLLGVVICFSWLLYSEVRAFQKAGIKR